MTWRRIQKLTIYIGTQSLIHMQTPYLLYVVQLLDCICWIQLSGFVVKNWCSGYCMHGVICSIILVVLLFLHIHASKTFKHPLNVSFKINFSCCFNRYVNIYQIWIDHSILDLHESMQLFNFTTYINNIYYGPHKSIKVSRFLVTCIGKLCRIKSRFSSTVFSTKK